MGFLSNLLSPVLSIAGGAIGGPVGSAIGGALGGAISGGSSQGSTNGGSGQIAGSNVYSPRGLNAADQGWQDTYGQQLINAGITANKVYPGYQRTFEQQNAINYDPFLNGAYNASQQYGHLGDVNQYWSGQYGDQARNAMGQQGKLYGAGNQTYQTALDPQNELYDRTVQRLQDQVRAGQAARGLGNSAYGAGLEDQAMGNFNIDWQNQQLARQTQGLNAMNAASEAGQSQGRLMGAAASGAMSSAQQIPDFLMQQGQIPINAQQYIANQPAANANQFAQNMGGMNQQYANIGQQAIPYMYAGAGAQQAQQTFNTRQNAADANMYTQLGKGVAGSGIGQSIANNYNTPGSWLSNLPGGGQGSANVAGPVNNFQGGEFSLL